jgi:general stress protein 26
MDEEQANSRMTIMQIIEAIDAGGAVFFLTKQDTHVLRAIPVNTKAFRILLNQDPDKEDAEIQAYVDFDGDVMIASGMPRKDDDK